MLIWINKNVGFQPSFSRQGIAQEMLAYGSFGLTKKRSPRGHLWLPWCPLSVWTAFVTERPCISTGIGGYSIPDCRWQVRILPSPVHDAHRIQFRGRVDSETRLLSQLHHDTTAHSICQVTERLLDAVVPFIALRPQAVSWLRYEVIIVGKGTTFLRDFCGLQLSFIDCCCWLTNS